MKKDITDRFFEFHATNPMVYEFFCQFALRAIAQRRKVGAKALVERIRWELNFEIQSDDEFKINNDFTSRYARKFVSDFPEYEKFIEIRQLKS